MQPNNPNPYYPPRDPAVPAMPQPAGGAKPNFSGLPKSGPSWGWIIVTILLVTALLGALGFAFWAFAQRQDYKNNSDKKAAAAVEVAKKQQIDEDNKRFAEELKNPLKTYVGPESYGSVSLQYPKTWSGYAAVNNATNGAVLTATFHPDIIPGVASSGGSGVQPAMALRVQILNQSYDQVVNKYASAVKQATVVASPYTLPKMPDQVGVKFVGQLSSKLSGTEIVIPVRDKTLVLSTDTDQYLPDFNTYILPNVTFVP